MVLDGKTDLVNASRLGSRPASMPYANYLANWLFAFVSWILLVSKPPTFTPACERPADHARKNQLRPNGPALPVDLLLKPALLGYRISEVFIPYGERIGETTLQR